MQAPMKYLSNPALPTISQDWKGSPVDSQGRFFHPDYPFSLSWKDVLKWQLSANPYREQKKKDRWKAAVIKDDSFLNGSHDLSVWLGHASFFFRLNGLRILIDPVFGKLSSLTPRYSELPATPDKFQHIDLLLLTHDHRDHCDETSLRFLLKNNPRAHVVCGLGLKKVLQPWAAGQQITEMGWFQQINLERGGLSITYLPTRHWCRRYLTDMNQRLWGSFVLQASASTLYFGGDSGYGPHFAQTASFFPHIDYAFLGIGAFAPEWFMHTNHMGPADAWKAFHDLGAQRLIPMHYGTFDLSDEPLGEPERLLREITGSSPAPAFLSIGEQFLLPSVKTVLF